MSIDPKLLGFPGRILPEQTNRRKLVRGEIGEIDMKGFDFLPYTGVERGK